MVGRLPEDRKLERAEAHALDGQLLTSQHRFPEALEQFQQGLTISKTFMNRDNAELAYAHYRVGLALRITGDSKHGLAHYREGEEILTRVRELASDDSLKTRYGRALKQMFESHAALFKQTGDVDAAADFEKRAASLN